MASMNWHAPNEGPRIESKDGSDISGRDSSAGMHQYNCLQHWLLV